MKPLIGTANLLANQAVIHAQGFLDGQIGAPDASERTIYLLADLRRLKQSQLDLPTSSIIDATMVLTTALRSASANKSGEDQPFATARAERWRELLPCLIEHVRRESLSLNEEGHFA